MFCLQIRAKYPPPLHGKNMYSRAELKQLKTDFWEGFSAYCLQHKAFKHRRNKFILYDTKLKGVELKFEVSRWHAGVMIEFNGSPDLRSERYEQFATYRYLFDEVFTDTPLKWLVHHRRESGEEVARIVVQQQGLDIHRREHWADFYHFMASNMQRMENVFVQVKEWLE